MKYRIVTDGSLWKIQRCAWLFWKDVGCWHNYDDGTVHEEEMFTGYYPTWNKAITDFYDKFGHGAKLMRPWVVALGPLPTKIKKKTNKGR